MKKSVILLAALIFLLSACSKPAYSPLNRLSDDYSLEDAKADKCVVYEDGDITSGQPVWDDFVQASRNGKDAAVRLAFYYTLGKPSQYAPELYAEIKDDYPLLYIQDLTYNGDTYSIEYYDDSQLITKQYTYLVKYTGAPKSQSAIFSEYTYYVLVNDNTVTWDKLEFGLFSSQSGDYIDHYRVYADLVFKGE